MLLGCAGCCCGRFGRSRHMATMSRFMNSTPAGLMVPVWLLLFGLVVTQSHTLVGSPRSTAKWRAVHSCGSFNSSMGSRRSLGGISSSMPSCAVSA